MARRLTESLERLMGAHTGGERGGGALGDAAEGRGADAILPDSRRAQSAAQQHPGIPGLRGHAPPGAFFPEKQRKSAVLASTHALLDCRLQRRA